MHVPVPTNVTLAPASVQTPALPAPSENDTARPELAVAETVYPGPPTAAPVGALDVKLIDWTLSDGVAIVNDCWTCDGRLIGAVACLVRVDRARPAPTSETLAPETVHTPALEASAVNVTARPEVAVAVTV